MLVPAGLGSILSKAAVSTCSQLTINANGKNVTIIGQNGAGKSSVYKAFLFVLGQDFKDIVTYGALKAVVKVDFDNGKSFCREFCPTSKPQNKFFVDGKITDSLAPLAGKNVNALKDEVKEELSLVKKDIVKTTGNIEYLHGIVSNSVAIVNNKQHLLVQVDDLQANLKNVEGEIAKLQVSTPVDYSEDIFKLQQKKTLTWGKIKTLDTKLQMLRDHYHELINSKPNVCPHCGRLIPVDLFVETRNLKISKLNEEGRKINADRKKLNELLHQQDLQLQELQIAQADCSADHNRQLLAQANDTRLRLTQELYSLNRQLDYIQHHEDTLSKIAGLQAKSKELNNELDQLTEMLKLISLFTLQKCKLIEQEVNDKFQYVTFKLFDYYKTTGEIKECCEVLLDGKPFSTALSTGERLKASLDCIKTLQEHFNVELPIFIDDAESITENSMLDLPNQLFTLKVVEGQNLTVEVQNG